MIDRYPIIILLAVLLQGLPVWGQASLEGLDDTPEQPQTQPASSDAESVDPADLPLGAVGEGDGSSLAWPPPDEPGAVLVGGRGILSADDPGSGSLLNEDDQDVPPTQTMDYEESAKKGRRIVAGSALINRRCILRVDLETGWAMVRFLPEKGQPHEPPRWVLPNRVLQEMEMTLADRPAAVFRISGENTLHEKKVFILIRKATILVDHPGLADEVAGAPPDDTAEATTQPADGTTDSSEDGSSDEPAVSSTDVGAALLAENPGAAVLTPVRRPYSERDEPGSVAPADDGEIFHPGRGHMVINRLVTILPVGEGNWMEAVFESDNTGQEPPLRLLPCHMVPRAKDLKDPEVMVKPQKRYHITGEITEYRGRRYLLLRKILSKRDMGEF